MVMFGECVVLFYYDFLYFVVVLFGIWLVGKIVYLFSDILFEICCQLCIEVDVFVGDFGVYCLVLWLVVDVVFDDVFVFWFVLCVDFIGLVVYIFGSIGQVQVIFKQLGQMVNEVVMLEVFFGSIVGQVDMVVMVLYQYIYGLLFKVFWVFCVGCFIYVGSVFFLEDLQCMMGLCFWLLLFSLVYLMCLFEQVMQLDLWQLCVIFLFGGLLLVQVVCDVVCLLGYCLLEIYGSFEIGGIVWWQLESDLL